MTTDTKLQISATFTWTAPVKYFFKEGEFPSNASEREILDLISVDAGKVIDQTASLEALQDHYNVSDSIDFFVDGELIHSGTDEDVKSDGEKRVQLIVNFTSGMNTNSSPSSMRSWVISEIFDEISEHADGPSEFEIGATYVK